MTRADWLFLKDNRLATWVLSDDRKDWQSDPRKLNVFEDVQVDLLKTRLTDWSIASTRKRKWFRKNLDRFDDLIAWFGWGNCSNRLGNHDLLDFSRRSRLSRNKELLMRNVDDGVFGIRLWDNLDGGRSRDFVGCCDDNDGQEANQNEGGLHREVWLR
jgi:hypothetical protein